MPSSDRPVFSRRHLFRALLGRDIPPAGTADRQSAAAPHATGDAAYAAGDFPAAVAAYRASVRHDLSNAAVRARLGYALYATGQTIQARVEFEHGGHGVHIRLLAQKTGEPFGRFLAHLTLRQLPQLQGIDGRSRGLAPLLVQRQKLQDLAAVPGPVIAGSEPRQHA